MTGRIGCMERMPGNSGEESSSGEGENATPNFGAFEIEAGAPRPATILRIADALEAQGGEILELFKEVSSPRGRAVFPIHLRQGGWEFFIEVETGPWEPRVAESLRGRAAILRSSEKADAELRVLGSNPVPDDVAFFASQAPAAILQLDMIWGDLESPEEFAELFRYSAGRRWGTELQYSVDFLPLVEELLTAAFDTFENGGARPPVLDEFVEGLGCFLGEIIRRGASGGEWSSGGEWGEGVVLEAGVFILDPIGKARAFMSEGAGDSISFYAGYALEEHRSESP
ncbi:MAG: hypothetical protein H0V75_12625 [Rubrobacter sp.]|nr:hypothetical protein [Rubrobacter sp.]